MPEHCIICGKDLLCTRSEDLCMCDPKDRRIAELESKVEMLSGALEGWRKEAERKKKWEPPQFLTCVLCEKDIEGAGDVCACDREERELATLGTLGRLLAESDPNFTVSHEEGRVGRVTEEGGRWEVDLRQLRVRLWPPNVVLEPTAKFLRAASKKKKGPLLLALMRSIYEDMHTTAIDCLLWSLQPQVGGRRAGELWARTDTSDLKSVLLRLQTILPKFTVEIEGLPIPSPETFQKHLPGG